MRIIQQQINRHYRQNQCSIRVSEFSSCNAKPQRDDQFNCLWGFNPEKKTRRFPVLAATISPKLFHSRQNPSTVGMASLYRTPFPILLSLPLPPPSTGFATFRKWRSIPDIQEKSYRDGIKSPPMWGDFGGQDRSKKRIIHFI